MTKFHRISLRLYTEDVEYLKLIFGRGYSEQLRDIIHQEINGIKGRIGGLTLRTDKDGNTTFRGIPIRIVDHAK